MNIRALRFRINGLIVFAAIMGSIICGCDKPAPPPSPPISPPSPPVSAQPAERSPALRKKLELEGMTPYNIFNPSRLKFNQVFFFKQEYGKEPVQIGSAASAFTSENLCAYVKHSSDGKIHITLLSEKGGSWGYVRSLRDSVSAVEFTPHRVNPGDFIYKTTTAKTMSRDWTTLAPGETGHFIRMAYSDSPLGGNSKKP